MKILLLRIWRTLLVIGNFCWHYILVPFFLFSKRKGTALFKQHHPKLNWSYWQRQTIRLRQFNWRKARLGDFAVLGRGALRLVLFLILGFLVLYLVVYLGFLGGMPSQTALKAKQNNTASEVYSADSVLLGRYYIQDRTNVRYQDIAPW